MQKVRPSIEAHTDDLPKRIDLVTYLHLLQPGQNTMGVIYGIKQVQEIF